MRVGGVGNNDIKLRVLKKLMTRTSLVFSDIISYFDFFFSIKKCYV